MNIDDVEQGCNGVSAVSGYPPLPLLEEPLPTQTETSQHRQMDPFALLMANGGGSKALGQEKSLNSSLEKGGRSKRGRLREVFTRNLTAGQFSQAAKHLIENTENGNPQSRVLCVLCIERMRARSGETEDEPMVLLAPPPKGCMIAVNHVNQLQKHLMVHHQQDYNEWLSENSAANKFKQVQASTKAELACFANVALAEFSMRAMVPLHAVYGPAMQSFLDELLEQAAGVVGADKQKLSIKIGCKETLCKYRSMITNMTESSVLDAVGAIVNASECAGVPLLSLTADIWRGGSDANYLALFAGFVDNQWVRHDALIGFEALTDRHTGANLATRIQNILNRCSQLVCDEEVVHKYVSSLAVDGASNNTVCARKLGVPRVWCSAHRVHLVLTAALGEAQYQKHLQRTRCENQDNELDLDVSFAQSGDNLNEEGEKVADDKNNQSNTRALGKRAVMMRASAAVKLKLRCNNGHLLERVDVEEHEMDKCSLHEAGTPKSLAMYRCRLCDNFSVCGTCIFSTCLEKHDMNEHTFKQDVCCDACGQTIAAGAVFFCCDSCFDFDVCVKCRGAVSVASSAPVAAYAPEAANDVEIEDTFEGAHSSSPNFDEASILTKLPVELLRALNKVRIRQGRFRRSSVWRDLLIRLQRRALYLQDVQAKDKQYPGAVMSSVFGPNKDKELERKIADSRIIGPVRAPPTRWTALFAQVKRDLRLDSCMDAAVHVLRDNKDPFLAHKEYGQQRERALLLSQAERDILAQFLSVSEPLHVLIQQLQTRNLSLGQQYVVVELARAAYAGIAGGNVHAKTNFRATVLESDGKRYLPRVEFVDQYLLKSELAPCIRLYAARLGKMLCKYFPPDDVPTPTLLSLALDPRLAIFVELPSPSSQKHGIRHPIKVVKHIVWQACIDALQKRLEELSEKLSWETEPSVHVDGEEQHIPPSLNQVFDEFMSKSSSVAEQNRSAPKWRQELDKYLGATEDGGIRKSYAEARIQVYKAKQIESVNDLVKAAFEDKVLLHFWKPHSDEIPLLAMLARSSFADFACSTLPEQTFSIASRVETRFRASLSPSTTRSLLVHLQNTEYAASVNKIFAQNKRHNQSARETRKRSRQEMQSCTPNSKILATTNDSLEAPSSSES